MIDALLTLEVIIMLLCLVYSLLKTTVVVIGEYKERYVLIDYRPIKLRARPPRSQLETVAIPVVRPRSDEVAFRPQRRISSVWLLLGLAVMFVGCFVSLVLMFD